MQQIHLRDSPNNLINAPNPAMNAPRRKPPMHKNHRNLQNAGNMEIYNGTGGSQNDV